MNDKGRQLKCDRSCSRSENILIPSNKQIICDMYLKMMMYSREIIYILFINIIHLQSTLKNFTAFSFNDNILSKILGLIFSQANNLIG